MPDAPSPPAPNPVPPVRPDTAGAIDSADVLFRMLGRLHARGVIGIRLDYRRLGHMDCPIAREADGNLWAYGLIALALLALWRFGWGAALGAAALGGLAYATLGHIHVRRQLRRRLENHALVELNLWRALWRFGGVTLVPAEGEACTAPEGNWMALVRAAAPSDGLAEDKKIGP